jgi:hypothetical protein
MGWLLKKPFVSEFGSIPWECGQLDDPKKKRKRK